MNNSLSICLFCFFLLCLSCQKEYESKPFDIIKDDKGKEATLEITEITFPGGSYKYAVAKAVYDDLVQAKGDKSVLTPKFKMQNSEKSAATFYPSSLEIVLEEKAYDVCVEMGTDSLHALACLLGHELTHYYEKHGGASSFSQPNEKKGSSSKTFRDKINSRTANEREADYKGGMLAYSAGFLPHEIMPRLLKQIYKGYGLGENIPGYPPLSDRIKDAELAQVKLKSLIDVFDMANYLLALGEYEAAKAYYEFIVVDYQSREIYNNLGVIACNAALNHFNKADVKYAIPLELDVQSWLKKNPKGAEKETVQLRTALINDAIRYFRKAETLDSAYAVAQLNLGCAYYLNNNTAEAIRCLKEVRRLVKAVPIKYQKTLSDSYVLLGIIAADAKKKDKSKAYFEKAIELDQNHLATLNLAILNGEKNNLIKNAIEENVDLQEAIENISLGEIIAEDEVEHDTEFFINQQYRFYVNNFKQSKLYIHVEREEIRLLLHKTSPGYKGKTTKGVRIGFDVGTLLSEYNGLEQNCINLSVGSMLVFRSREMIFEVDGYGDVKEWCLYQFIE